MRTHEDIEARSLALHALVARRLREDPRLLDRARSTLARWRADVSPRSRPWLDEWQRVLDAGVQATVAVLLDRSERAATLRQCSPFAGVLTNRERFELLKAWRVTHAP